jgi:molybdenum cofactor cytidylyltransferase
MITGILLSAGGARRFGSQKLIAEIDGTPVVLLAAQALIAATNETVAVVGHEGAKVRAALAGSGVHIVENAEWAAGMGTSLACGIRALSPTVDAVLVALGDQPGIDVYVARRVVALWEETGRPIVAARYSDGRGHPVLFAREIFDELLMLEGDHGARTIITEAPERVAFVDVDLPAPSDIDTPDDLRRLNGI